MTQELLLSVVAPCLNEQEVLGVFVARVTAVCLSVAGDRFEIILVNDGSTDATLAGMQALAEKNAALVIVNLSRRFGHQAALTAGLSLARGARVLTIDADLQDPPELLPQMMEVLDSGADVAFGQRTKREGETFFKKIEALFFYRFLKGLTDPPIPEDAGDFRLMSRRVVDALLSMPERSRFLRGMTSWIGFVQKPVLYVRAPRAAGVTKYPFRKMVRFALDAITGFSVFPLRLASYGGAVFGLSGFVLLLYVFYAWFSGETVAGWTSLMVVVLLIGGVQLVCLGVFGEYLGRLYMDSKQRPLFIVESVIRKKTEENP